MAKKKPQSATMPLPEEVRSLLNDLAALLELQGDLTQEAKTILSRRIAAVLNQETTPALSVDPLAQILDQPVGMGKYKRQTWRHMISTDLTYLHWLLRKMQQDGELTNPSTLTLKVMFLAQRFPMQIGDAAEQAIAANLAAAAKPSIELPREELIPVRLPTIDNNDEPIKPEVTVHVCISGAAVCLDVNPDDDNAPLVSLLRRHGRWQIEATVDGGVHNVVLDTYDDGNVIVREPGGSIVYERTRK